MAKAVRLRDGFSSPGQRKTPTRDALTEQFFRLNEQFGELIDGRVAGPDDFVTDPPELAKYSRPSDDEIKEIVAAGLRDQQRLRRS